MQKIFPEKLKTSDEIKVIAPSRSAAILSSENYDLAFERMRKEFKFVVGFGKHHQEKACPRAPRPGLQ